MRVLVTGASGLLGSAICDALLARGDEVVGLTRDPEKARPKNPTVTWHAWRATTEPPPPAALEGVDGVVNLIGEEINQRLTDKAKVRIRESRIIGTRNLLQGIEAPPTEPSVFVGQSAIGYYGDRGAEAIDEESGPGEGFTAEIPIDWEAAEREAEGIFDRVVIFRTGLVLDQGRWPAQAAASPLQARGRRPDRRRRPVHVLDPHRGRGRSSSSGRSMTTSVWGVINATAPNPVTNRELSKALGRALHRPAFMPVPKFAVAALRGGDLADAVAGGARVAAAPGTRPRLRVSPSGARRGAAQRPALILRRSGGRSGSSRGSSWISRSAPGTPSSNWTLPLPLGVQLVPEENRQVRDPHPDQDDDHARQRAIDLVVGAELRDVEPEARGGEQPDHERDDPARGDPLEAALLDVRATRSR